MTSGWTAFGCPRATWACLRDPEHADASRSGAMLTMQAPTGAVVICVEMRGLCRATLSGTETLVTRWHAAPIVVTVATLDHALSCIAVLRQQQAAPQPSRT